MVKTKAVVFTEVPTEYPEENVHLTVKDIEVDLTAPPNGIAYKVLQVSVDPYMRGRMRDPAKKSYSPGFTINETIDGGGLAIVTASNNAAFPVKALIYGRTLHQEHATTASLEGWNIVDNPYSLPIEHFLGVLGMPGLTAFTSFYEYGKPKKGETIFISAASGAVGSVVGQLAKREGMYVVGAAGSDEKVKYLIDELKFDAAFNYKTEHVKEALPKYCPKGIDIYYDNVGGEILDESFINANNFARFIECGMISQYNKKPEDQYGLRNTMLIVGKQLAINGFIVSSLAPKYFKEFYEKVPKWINDKELFYKEDVTVGIENEVQGLVGMLKGKNFGKAVIKYADLEA